MFKTITKKEELDVPLFLVPRPGLEPGWVAPLVFETSASTDSAIWAWLVVSSETACKITTFTAKYQEKE